LHAVRVAARLRRELRTDVEMVRGRYGEFKVLVDGDTVVDGGALAALGVLPSGRKVLDAVRAKLLSFALSLPEAVEDHPWDETVVKVRKKVFVFFGGDPSRHRITVKLVESHGHALSIEGAEPTGYGLGKAGG